MKKFSLLWLPVIALVITGMTFTSDDGGVSHEEAIQGTFETPQDITRACLECHPDAGEAMLHTRHWNWEGEPVAIEGHGEIRIGKKDLINNYCIAVTSNYPRCTSCHPGYGWADSTFDFSNPENMDCLICHDRTGTYRKTPTAAGMPDPSVDLVYVAKNVGMPTKENCGGCHFNGGGGTGVKHGDMDESLLKATRELDVHMGGLGFNCTDCHTTVDHQIMGASHGSMASGTNHIACTDCHDNETKVIHKDTSITRHLDRIACETCHIPTFAREMPTKTYWDWSTAGLRETEKNASGEVIYDKKKGDFRWAKNVVPEYRWYNGSADYYLPGDAIDNPSTVLELNKLNGNINDPDAKIAPFKMMRGKQIFDVDNNYLIIPKLFGPGGFWATYEWHSAAELGMKEAGLPYSGNYGFINTEMAWPINHMVAPKGDALKCEDCHGDKATRLDWVALGYPGDPAIK